MADDPQQILADAEVLAVVGASRESYKPAHTVPAQMQRHGWRIIPVNPYADELFGEKVYRKVADIPHPVDVVVVFRPSADATEVVREAVAAGAPAVWLQLDIVSAEEGDHEIVARYAWRADEGRPAGRMIITPRGDRIARLVVTFE